jgi:hypothetical protein
MGLTLSSITELQSEPNYELAIEPDDACRICHAEFIASDRVQPQLHKLSSDCAIFRSTDR